MEPPRKKRKIKDIRINELLYPLEKPQHMNSDMWERVKAFIKQEIKKEQEKSNNTYIKPSEVVMKWKRGECSYIS